MKLELTPTEVKIVARLLSDASVGTLAEFKELGGSAKAYRAIQSAKDKVLTVCRDANMDWWEG